MTDGLGVDGHARKPENDRRDRTHARLGLAPGLHEPGACARLTTQPHNETASPG